MSNSTKRLAKADAETENEPLHQPNERRIGASWYLLHAEVCPNPKKRERFVHQPSTSSFSKTVQAIARKEILLYLLKSQ
jgi:hypothetical protein